VTPNKAASQQDSDNQAGYDLHIFVCTNKRENTARPSCGNMNSEALRAQLKTWLSQRIKTDPTTANLRVRVNSAGCLDYCEQGIAVAAYPMGEMHLQVNSPESVEDLKTKIEAEVQKLTQRHSESR
jgi:(2Fe-2S) ferredoxin